ncbi:dehydrogenase [Romboutsia maritimum]|uniref:Dehydrogenase n=1 Tax=Romboutsia maritimum TaxID=2020948 RepID=A0A371IS21_9FIRM|nr:dehydrogenase [Romboutsia maritimum]RDY23269.1 dehydrogenase [Romboutsia maritimum]
MIIKSRAPLRLGLAGGGTDVSPYSDNYGGYVLNVTIDMYAYCIIEPTNDNKIVFNATDRNETFEIDSQPKIDATGDLLLHKGVYNKIVEKFNSKKPLSFKMTTYSDAPAGSGLGSSSTMVVAIIKGFVEWLNLPLGEYDIASLAYEIEREDLKLSGGKQDQYAATFGGFNFMEFYENHRVIVNPLRVKKWIKNELESSLLLYYTGTSRDSAKIIDEQVRHTKNKDDKTLEAMHLLKEGALTMKEAILKGNFELLTQCIKDSWKAKKNTASVISNQKIEEAYDFIIEHGGKAAKISGAGGGGFMMIIVDSTKKHSLYRNLVKRDGKVFSINIVENGTEAWTIY